MTGKLLVTALAMFMIPGMITMPLYLLDVLSPQFNHYYTYWNIATFYVLCAGVVSNVWDFIKSERKS